MVLGILDVGRCGLCGSDCAVGGLYLFVSRPSASNRPQRGAGAGALDQHQASGGGSQAAGPGDTEWAALHWGLGRMAGGVAR